MKTKTKRCTKCNIEKSLDDFYDRRGDCKKCAIKQVMASRQKNIGRYNIRMKEWRKRNPEKLVLHAQAWRKRNPEKYNAIERIRRKRNPEKIKISKRKTYRKNRKSSIFRLNGSISTGIYLSLKGMKVGRKWESLVGFDLEDLKNHLEKQFTKDMTWDNYGRWHIDHKIPISAFNFTESEHRDFKRCWALDNLQPMWAKENISKGAKLTKPFQPSLRL